MKIIIKKAYREGMASPNPFYGVAYQDYLTRYLVFAPIPLNIILSWARDWYYRLCAGRERDLSEAIRSEVEREWDRVHGFAYDKGLAEGKEAGFKNGQEMYMATVSAL